MQRDELDIDPVWRDSFDAFFKALGERPDGAVLSRHDLNGAYDSTNCFWEERRLQVERVRIFKQAIPDVIASYNGVTKICSKCRQEKAVSDFYVNRSAAKTGLHSCCKKCISVKVRNAYRKHLVKRLVTAAKNRARLRGLEFSLTEEDLGEVPTHCPVLGIEFTLGGKRTPNSASLDRKDNAKGYIAGNVEIISWQANRLKNDASIDELEKIVAWMRGDLNLDATAGLTAGLL